MRAGCARRATARASATLLCASDSGHWGCVSDRRRHIRGDVHLHSKVRRLSQWAQCTHFQRVRALLHVHTRSGCGVPGSCAQLLTADCSPQKKIGKLVEFGIGVSIVVVLRGPPNPPALGSVQVRVGFRACILAPAGLRIACSIGVLYYGRRKRKPNPTCEMFIDFVSSLLATLRAPEAPLP